MNANVYQLENRLKARWDAVKAISGDNLNVSYEKAGLLLNRDGRFARVLKDGVVVAYMTPKFNRRELHDALISNIQDDAKCIAEIFEEAYRGLNIPDGYSFIFDSERDVRDIASFHGHQMSAHIRLAGENVDHLPNQVDVELRVFLDEPRAHVFATKGPRFFGQNVRLLDDKEPFFKAESYEALATNLVSFFNKQILERADISRIEPTETLDGKMNGLKAAVPEKHYSELILDELVAKHGWGDKVYSAVSAGRIFYAGVLKVVPGHELKCAFDVRGRYLSFKADGVQKFDVDCRDKTPKEVALAFETRVQELVTSAQLSILPHEMVFADFAKIARVEKLENHGRTAEVFFGKLSLGFCDSINPTEALRQAHSREVNNAIYSHTVDAQYSLEKTSFPPAHVLAEYPDIQALFAKELEARRIQTVIQNKQPQQFERGVSESYDQSYDEAEEIACKRDGWILAYKNEIRTFAGKGLGMTAHHVVQSLGKTAVIHEKRNLDRVPDLDEVVNISYDGIGQGKVQPQVKKLDKSQSR